MMPYCKLLNLRLPRMMPYKAFPLDEANAPGKIQNFSVLKPLIALENQLNIAPSLHTLKRKRREGDVESFQPSVVQAM